MDYLKLHNPIIVPRTNGFDVHVHKNGERVGLLQVDERSNPRRAILQAVDVDEPFQRQGIASAMYQAAHRELNRRGIDRLHGALEGSGTVQLRERTFGPGSTKYFHGHNEEVTPDEAQRIMDEDYGRLTSETMVPKIYKSIKIAIRAQLDRLSKAVMRPEDVERPFTGDTRQSFEETSKHPILQKMRKNQQGASSGEPHWANMGLDWKKHFLNVDGLWKYLKTIKQWTPHHHNKVRDSLGYALNESGREHAAMGGGINGFLGNQYNRHLKNAYEALDSINQNHSIKEQEDLIRSGIDSIFHARAVAKNHVHQDHLDYGGDWNNVPRQWQMTHADADAYKNALETEPSGISYADFGKWPTHHTDTRLIRTRQVPVQEVFDDPHWGPQLRNAIASNNMQRLTSYRVPENVTRHEGYIGVFPGRDYEFTLSHPSEQKHHRNIVFTNVVQNGKRGAWPHDYSKTPSWLRSDAVKQIKSQYDDFDRAYRNTETLRKNGREVPPYMQTFGKVFADPAFSEAHARALKGEVKPFYDYLTTFRQANNLVPHENDADPEAFDAWHKQYMEEQKAAKKQARLGKSMVIIKAKNPYNLVKENQTNALSVDERAERELADRASQRSRPPAAANALHTGDPELGGAANPYGYTREVPYNTNNLADQRGEQGVYGVRHTLDRKRLFDGKKEWRMESTSPDFLSPEDYKQYWKHIRAFRKKKQLEQLGETPEQLAEREPATVVESAPAYPNPYSVEKAVSAPASRQVSLMPLYSEGKDNPRHEGRVSVETIPGVGTGVLPEAKKAPLGPRNDYHKAVTATLFPEGGKGRDVVAQAMGLPTVHSYIRPGSYIEDGELSNHPSSQIVMRMPVGDAHGRIDEHFRPTLEAYADVLRRLFDQHTVGYSKPHGTPGNDPKRANALYMHIGRGLNPAETESLTRALPDYALINGLKGAQFLSWDDDHTHFHKKAMDAAEKFIDPDVKEIRFQRYSSDSNLIGDDWENSDNAESYRRGLRESGRPDVRRELYSVLYPRIAEIHQHFSQKHGWGKPGDRNREWGKSVGFEPAGSDLLLAGQPADTREGASGARLGQPDGDLQSRRGASPHVPHRALFEDARRGAEAGKPERIASDPVGYIEADPNYAKAHVRLSFLNGDAPDTGDHLLRVLLSRQHDKLGLSHRDAAHLISRYVKAAAHGNIQPDWGN